MGTKITRQNEVGSRTNWLVLALPVLLLIGLIVLIAAPPPSARGGATPEAEGCSVRPLDSLGLEEFASVEDWLDSHQKGFAAVENVLDSAVADDEEGALARLRKGVIGPALDPLNEQLRVVIDPTIADRDALQSRLDQAVAALPDERPLVVKVAPGCHSAESIRRAYMDVEARDWQQPGEPVAMTFGIDPSNSTVRVGVDPAASESEAALAGLGDEAITVVESNMSTWRR